MFIRKSNSNKEERVGGSDIGKMSNFDLPSHGSLGLVRHEPEMLMNTDKNTKKTFKKSKGCRVSKKTKGFTTPKRMSPERIHNMAIFYLSQRDATSLKIEEMLIRRAYKWLHSVSEEDRDSLKEEFLQNVRREIDRLEASGLLNNQRYADNFVRRSREKGLSEQKIKNELNRLGVTSEGMNLAFERYHKEKFSFNNHASIAENDSDLEAAILLCRRKKIFAFRAIALPEGQKERAKIQRRECGVLARAGHSPDVIQKLISYNIEDVEDPL